MKSMKLNTSAKYKNNKFQIKYLKYERYNMGLFDVSDVVWGIYWFLKSMKFVIAKNERIIIYLRIKYWADFTFLINSVKNCYKHW